jgi:hypothetical protein
MNTKNVGWRPDTTTAPVQAAPVPAAASDIEFVDSEGLEQRFSIGRSLAYELAGQGLIAGVSLRRRGQTRGKRLWNVDSVRRYLASLMPATRTESEAA